MSENFIGKVMNSKVTWGKVSEASGYELYRATSSKGTYSKLATITRNSSVSYVNSKVTKGKVYYYKIKSYRIVNGKKVYSTYSPVAAGKS